MTVEYIGNEKFVLHLGKMQIALTRKEIEEIKSHDFDCVTVSKKSLFDENVEKLHQDDDVKKLH